MCKEVNDTTGYECMLGCNSQPCQNGGSCTTSPDDPNGYVCECAIGYTGRLCDQKLHAVCYYNGKTYIHGEIRIAECNKCHCKFGSWLCTTKFCGTIAVMLDFTEDFSLLTGRTAKFKNAFELHLAESIHISRNVIQDMQISAGSSIHIEFNLVATADVEADIEDAATNVVLLLDSGHYIFPFEGHAFHVDPTSVQLVKYEPTEENQTYKPVVTHSLLVTVCVVVSVTLVLAVIAGLIIIFVKRSKSEKTAVDQFNTPAGINMNKLNNTCAKQNNLESRQSYNSVSKDSDDESGTSEGNTKNINLYRDDDLY
ncbi:uncharacterized protein [Amphiura filiformis]|uniref:uncharacterized protein n=1 Tax=Amphiura filiformis TaxID=82378 RepID=UPI003B21242F